MLVVELNGGAKRNILHFRLVRDDEWHASDKRLSLEAVRLEEASPTLRPVESVGDVAKVIADADPKLKAEAYADLGIRLSYRPAENLVSVQAAPCAAERVGGGT